MHKLAMAIILGLGLAVVPITHETRPASSQGQGWSLSPADEAAFVGSLNAVRAANGLPPLQVSDSMTAAARNWSGWMASNGVLQHAGDIVSGAPANWSKVGENVGRGGGVESVFGAFMNSPSHAANVLDPAYTLVGVGVVWTTDGLMYTTHRFAAVAAPAPPPPPPPPPPPAAPEPAAPPAPPAPAPSDLAFLPADLAAPEPDPGSSPAGGPQGTEPVPQEEAGPEPSGPRRIPSAEPARVESVLRLLLASGNL